jgi:hypothetical protein
VGRRTRPATSSHSPTRTTRSRGTKGSAGRVRELQRAGAGAPSCAAGSRGLAVQWGYAFKFLISLDRSRARCFAGGGDRSSVGGRRWFRRRFCGGRCTWSLGGHHGREAPTGAPVSLRTTGGNRALGSHGPKHCASVSGVTEVSLRDGQGLSPPWAGWGGNTGPARSRFVRFPGSQGLTARCASPFEFSAAPEVVAARRSLTAGCYPHCAAPLEPVGCMHQPDARCPLVSRRLAAACRLHHQ